MIKTIIQDTSGGKTVGPAIPIEVLASAAGTPVEAKVMRVIAVDPAQVAAGNIKVVGGRPVPVVMSSGSQSCVDGPIQLVYVVSGVLT